MEIIDSKTCAKAFLNKITFTKGTDKAVIEIGAGEDLKHIHVDVSSLVYFATLGIKSFDFDSSNCMLVGESGNGEKVDLSAIIISSVAGNPPVSLFTRLSGVAPQTFHYYCRIIIKGPGQYDLTKASLACSHFHGFFEDSYNKENLNAEYVSTIKSGRIAELVGLMRRRVTNPGFVNGFVDFTANEQATVRISAPIIGGERSGGYVKIDMLFNTLLNGTDNLKEPVYFIYNGETNTLMCRNVKPKDNSPAQKFVPWVKLAYPNTANFVSNAVVMDNDLKLDLMLDETAIVSSASIEGFAPVSFANPPARRPQPAKKETETATDTPAKPVKAKKVAKAPMDKDAVINAAKAVIFNNAIPPENAITILRNFNW